MARNRNRGRNSGGIASEHLQPDRFQVMPSGDRLDGDPDAPYSDDEELSPLVQLDAISESGSESDSSDLDESVLGQLDVDSDDDSASDFDTDEESARRSPPPSPEPYTHVVTNQKSALDNKAEEIVHSNLVVNATYHDSKGNPYYSRDFYYTSEGTRVFIINPDEVPHNKSDFTTLMSPSIEKDYLRVGEKSGGVNDAGSDGGNYKFFYTIAGEVDAAGAPFVRSQMLVLKQDNGYEGPWNKMVNKSSLTKPLIFGEKKKVLQGKVIAEFVAARIMNAMIGESASSVFYALKPGGKRPDKTGDNVYIGSVFFDGYDDLFRDIARAQNIPVSGVDKGVNYKRIKFAGSINNDMFEAGMMVANSENEILYFNKEGRVTYTKKPKNTVTRLLSKVTKSVGYDYKNAEGDPISQDEAIKLGGKPRCRFHDLARVCMVSLLVGDFDIHTGNLGVVTERENGFTVKGTPDKNALRRDPDTNELILDAFGKLGRLVKIDHAAAFHDLSDEVKPHSHEDHPAHKGPTNHWREVSRDLRVSKEVAEEAERIANFDQAELARVIREAIEDTKTYYGATPLYKFAHRAGLSDEVLMANYVRSGAGDATAAKNILELLKAGKLTDAEDDRVKELLGEQTIAYLCQKMFSRQASLRKYAFDIKMSLCVKLDKNGEFYVDNTDYALKDVMQEYPEFIAENSVRYRSREHFVSSTFNKNFVDEKVIAVAAEEMQKTVLATAKRALGKHMHSVDVADYAMIFYKKSTPEEALSSHNRLVPDDVYHVVVSETTMAKSYGAMYKAQQKASPNLTTDTAAKISHLKPTQFALNFVENKSKEGKSGYYVEHVTEDNKYQITAHRLPPEINKTTIFKKSISELIDPVLLRSHPALPDEIKQIARALKIKDGGIDFSELHPEQEQLLVNILNATGLTPESFADQLLGAYDSVTRDEVASAPGLFIPSPAYIDFAKKQCESFFLNQGPDAKLRILPRDNEDPLLIQAYALVCRAYGWDYKNASKCYEADPIGFDNLVTHPAAVAAVRVQLNIMPSMPSPTPSSSRSLSP